MWYLNPKNWAIIILCMLAICAGGTILYQRGVIADQEAQIAKQDAEIDTLHTMIAGYEEQKAICEKNVQEAKAAANKMQQIAQTSASIQTRITELRATLQADLGSGPASPAEASAPVAPSEGEHHAIPNDDVVALANDLVRFFNAGLRDEAVNRPGKASGDLLPGTPGR